MHIMLIFGCCYSFFKNFNPIVANQKLRQASGAEIYNKKRDNWIQSSRFIISTSYHWLFIAPNDVNVMKCRFNFQKQILR